MRLLLVLLFACISVGSAFAQPKNVVFILSDDHRYDFFSAHPNAPDFLNTPAMDRMAREGAHLSNAFVTTALCSPSRASILTGQYAHNHGVVDNSTDIPEGTRFFPEDLQEAGYNTAYIGKWHMGDDSDDPRAGFDRWVSFKGQGTYFDPNLNVDGERRNPEGYTSDILTEYALDFLQEQNGEEPFFMILSHKAVHAEFMPAPRHQGAYADIDIPYPASMPNTARNYWGKPEWVKKQRGSWHGVDYMYQGALEFDGFYRRYAETLLGLDESIGRVIEQLDTSGLAENTLVIYMGDNGFLLGEHGLIDKRNAYEESMRVPMLAWSPGYVEAGTTIDGLVRNIDIASTIYELTGVESRLVNMDGSSFLGLLEGEAPNDEGREFLYQYYWEHAFPHTPTTFALRGNQYKYIYYHGVWDRDELYDLTNDPQEMVNLAEVPAFAETARAMRQRLYDLLEAEDAMRVPMRRGTWSADEWLLDK
ncbi:MAG: sulfatase [Bacteroidota bacterium]